jgi:FkbM family methyltransferase
MTVARRTTRTIRSATPLRVKQAVASVLVSDPMAAAIHVLTRDRIRQHGLVFDVSSDEFTPKVRAQMFWGLYERAECEMIREHLTGARTVIELGSSLGVTSTFLGSVLSAGGQLICVEANPALIPGLQRRVASRFDEVDVHILNVAVSHESGTVQLAIGATTMATRVTEVTAADQRTIRVAAVTLQDILDRFGIDTFDLVSDIEGSEAAFLMHDAAPMARCERAVIEMDDTVIRGRRVTVPELLDAAMGLGFRVVDRNGPVFAFARK